MNANFNQILSITVACILNLIQLPAAGQDNNLLSGPMLGPLTLRDASIWVQTKKDAKLQIVYQAEGPNQPELKSDVVKTNKKDGYCATVHLSELQPGTLYRYSLWIDKKKVNLPYPLSFRTQTHWQWRSDPPDFTFVTGSCFYINEQDYDRPGKPYGGDYEILDQICSKKPDLMVWLGDNTYLREGDFESRSGIYHRYTHTRSLEKLQPLLAQSAHYAIWDDHDYGPNDSDWTYPLKQHTLDAFRDFWPSEGYGAGHTDGVTNSFMWNDCQFFMLDNRWYRTVDRENGTILGEQQKYWLKEALLYSKATFKFICIGGQFLNDARVFENYSNYATERQEIIDFISEHKIKGVIFLTGDRHHSEISKLDTPNGTVIYDITSSAITSSTTDHSSEPNTLRVSGSMIGVRNFAVVKVAGKGIERKVQVDFFDKDGKKMFNYQIGSLK